jgi:uncharacterized protein YodC (DUF2158 family)
MKVIKESYKNKYSMKFKVGDRVKFIHSGNRLSPETATITGFDEDGFYQVKWDDGEISNGLGDFNLKLIVKPSNSNFTESKDYVLDNIKFEFEVEVTDKGCNIFSDGRQVTQGSSARGVKEWINNWIDNELADLKESTNTSDDIDLPDEFYEEDDPYKRSKIFQRVVGRKPTHYELFGEEDPFDKMMS